MTLIWVVPVVSAILGLVVVLACLPTLEGLSRELIESVRRLRDVRLPLSTLRHELHRGQPLVDELWRHWAREQSVSLRPRMDGPTSEHTGA
jgi:hypothetical protein